ncbi:MAG: hypothetical protein HY420_01425 [Candidatus Kerfeldbacteria bacterium]|nr:hypothetical protein [Candidatus Kerfeldbacteria bacterium]
MTEKKGKSVMSEHQPSMTEWFAEIGEIQESNSFRDEDNAKADRLEVLYQTVGVPYERPEKFAARDLVIPSPAFQKVLKERGNELCAIRLVPTRPNLPKLRNRGMTIQNCYEQWFLKQQIDPDAYVAYVCPHSETLLWSAIFVIGEQAIFGEIVSGLHAQLTHGDARSTVVRFRFDYHSWEWSTRNPEAERQVQRMIALLHVPDKGNQNALRSSLNASFAHDYLRGYFESTVWPDGTVYIIDYNRLLPRYISTPTSVVPRSTGSSGISGIAATAGRARGPVVIVREKDIGIVAFPPGSVLVCENTDVRYLPYMKVASAIVTDRGGILSHAAIIARELKKPCVVGTGRATQIFRSGDIVDVDAVRGVAERILS